MAKKRRRTSKKRKRFYKHIYFEAKIPRTRDSVTQAVKDVGRPGVRSSKEVEALAIAQFLDWLDGKTVDHHGKVVRFTGRIWAGRTKILYLLAKKYGGKRIVKQIVKLRRMVKAGKLSKTKARELALKLARKYKLPLIRTRI